jgi:hypothetical protein
MFCRYGNESLASQVTEPTPLAWFRQ